MDSKKKCTTLGCGIKNNTDKSFGALCAYVKDNAGDYYALTAGHNGKEGDSFKFVNSSKTNALGEIEEKFYNDRMGDWATIGVDDESIISNRIFHTYKRISGTAKSISDIKKRTLFVISWRNDKLLDDDVFVPFIYDKHETNGMIKGKYSSSMITQKGDSGSPVYYKSSNKSKSYKLAGIFLGDTHGATPRPSFTPIWIIEKKGYKVVKKRMHKK